MFNPLCNMNYHLWMIYNLPLKMRIRLILLSLKPMSKLLPSIIETYSSTNEILQYNLVHTLSALKQEKSTFT